MENKKDKECRSTLPFLMIVILVDVMTTFLSSVGAPLMVSLNSCRCSLTAFCTRAFSSGSMTVNCGLTNALTGCPIQEEGMRLTATQKPGRAQEARGERERHQ